MTDGSPRISAIVPTLDEERRIATTLEELVKALEALEETYEILVVDNASTDSTAEVVRRAAADNTNVKLLVNSENMGKGYSVRRGMLEARGDWRFFTDADLSTPVEEIERFWKLARQDEFGVIVGSRLAPGATVVRPQPLLRRLAGQACLSLTRMTVPGMPRDVFCGFKWFRGDIAEAVFARQITMGWMFDAEVLGRVRRIGVRILEVPIRWENDPESKLSMIRDLPSITAELWKIRKALRSQGQKGQEN